jgi:hypothetical protein
VSAEEGCASTRHAVLHTNANERMNDKKNSRRYDESFVFIDKASRDSSLRIVPGV